DRKADNASAAITPKSTAKVIIPANTKGADVDDASGISSFNSPGNVLGLGNYASDDDDEEEEEKEVKNTSVPPSSSSSKLPVHLSENGSSQVDDDVRGKKFLGESGSHRVSPNGAIESHNGKIDGEKIKSDNDFSNSTQSVNEGGLKAKNSLLDDSQGRSLRNGPDKSSKDKKHNKVDENSRTHDERHIKRAKQEDQNGPKEKLKDHDSGKKVSKAEVKDDKEERERDKRSRDKEDSRKREKEKDEKNERTKHKSVGDSSRRKRHHSPSPGVRGRSSKDNSSMSHARGSSDSSSDDSRRKVRSKRRDLSPSPVRSRRYFEVIFYHHDRVNFVKAYHKCQGLLASVLTAGILSILLLKPPGKGGGQGQDPDPGLGEDSIQADCAFEDYKLYDTSVCLFPTAFEG
ncbi:hypothetical protein M8C21_027585, partial [Ambrosia artemisiifolia]